MMELRCLLRRGDFSLDIEVQLEGQAIGLFGPSGSGKSSLLHALAGLLPVDELQVRFQGESLLDSTNAALPPAHRRCIGMVFQDHRLFPHLSIESNLRYGMAAGADHQFTEFTEIVELLDIAELLRQRPAECSGGQRQRVALGRALLAAPKLLLLDEPLASLDRGLRNQIIPYLRRVHVHFRLPMIMVGHDLGDVIACSDELVLLSQGRAIDHGSIDALSRKAANLELLHDCGLVFPMRGRVDHRDEDGLVWLRPDGEVEHRFACGACEAEAGDSVEALLRPQDIALAKPPLDVSLSLSNRIAGRVMAITQSGPSYLVHLDCHLDQPLLAEVTERAVRELSLAEGAKVIALWKAHAVAVRQL